MSADLKLLVEDLLYEYDAVIIPEFGGFVSTYKSAQIDHVQGMLHPPSKSLSFNPDLVVNDGILINALKNQKSLSAEEAKRAIQDFVDELQSKIEAREIIVFPKIGRIYMDYENKLQFLPDNTNFNLEAFGLGAVQYYPILRNKKPVVAEAVVPNPVPPVKYTSSRRPNNGGLLLQKAMPYLFGLALLVIAVSIYSMIRSNARMGNYQGLPVSESRFNTKPSLDLGLEDPNALDVDARFGTAVAGEADTAAAEAFFEEVDTEGITLAPNQQECVVIIGGFRSKENIQKLIQRIYEAGFDAYQDKKGRLTRVGAQFFYEGDQELEEKLEIIREKFEQNAWILKE